MEANGESTPNPERSINAVADELAELAAALVNESEAKARKEVAARIASMVATRRDDSPAKERAATLERVMHTQNDELITIQALIAGAVAVCAQGADAERILRVVGAKVDSVMDELAEYI